MKREIYYLIDTCRGINGVEFIHSYSKEQIYLLTQCQEEALSFEYYMDAFKAFKEIRKIQDTKKHNLKIFKMWV